MAYAFGCSILINDVSSVVNNLCAKRSNLGQFGIKRHMQQVEFISHLFLSVNTIWKSRVAQVYRNAIRTAQMHTETVLFLQIDIVNEIFLTE